MINNKVKAFFAIFITGCAVLVLLGWFLSGTPNGSEWNEDGQVMFVVGIIFISCFGGFVSDNVKD